MERQDQQLQQLTLTVNININDIRDLFSHLNGKPFHLSVSSESEATRLLPPMGYLLISIDNEELSILFWSIFIYLILRVMGRKRQKPKVKVHTLRTSGSFFTNQLPIEPSQISCYILFTFMKHFTNINDC